MVTAKRGIGVGVSVETAEVANGAITAAKLATDAVETLKIKALNVTTAKLAADAVDESKIADNAINKEHLNAGLETALFYLRLNAGATGLEYAAVAIAASDTMTFGGQTVSIDKLFCLGM